MPHPGFQTDFQQSQSTMSLEYAFAITRQLALEEEGENQMEHTWDSLANSPLLPQNRSPNQSPDNLMSKNDGETHLDSDVESVASDDMGHAVHSHAAEAALLAREELVNAVDFFLQWKDALVESYPLPSNALLPILTIASQLLRCRDILGNNISMLCKLAKSFADGLLSDEHVHRLKTESEQARLIAGMEKMRRLEAVQKTNACISLLRRMDDEIRYVRWYRLFLKLRQREHLKHSETQIEQLRETVQNLKSTVRKLRVSLKNAENKQTATAKVAVKNQARADSLEKEVKRLERKERKLRSQLNQTEVRLQQSAHDLNALKVSHPGPPNGGLLNEDDDNIGIQERGGIGDQESNSTNTNLVTRTKDEIDKKLKDVERKRIDVENSLVDRDKELKLLGKPLQEATQVFESEEEMEAKTLAAVEAAVNQEFEEVAAARAQEERIQGHLQKHRDSILLSESEPISNNGGNSATGGNEVATLDVSANDSRSLESEMRTNLEEANSIVKKTLLEAHQPSGHDKSQYDETEITKSNTPLISMECGESVSKVALQDDKGVIQQSQSRAHTSASKSSTYSPRAKSSVVRAARASSERRNKQGKSPKTGPSSFLVTKEEEHSGNHRMRVPPSEGQGQNVSDGPKSEVVPVPKNVITQMSQAHAKEIMKLQVAHSRQVESLKLTMAALQEKLISRGRELTKLRQRRGNGRKKVSLNRGPVAVDTRIKKSQKKKGKTKEAVKLSNPGVVDNPSRSVKFTIGGIASDMSDVGTPWPQHSAPTRPETTIGGRQYQLSEKEVGGKAKAAHVRRPSTVDTSQHSSLYYMSPVDRSVMDATLKDAISKSSTGIHARDDSVHQPLRLPANFMPLAPPRLASHASKSNMLRDEHERLLGVRRNARADALPHRPITSETGRSNRAYTRRSRHLKMNQINLLHRPDSVR